jgi:hypothetical protein
MWKFHLNLDSPHPYAAKAIGWLIQAASWRLIFAINLPLAVLVVAVAWRHVPESKAEAATGRVDFAGGALVTLGLIGVTYGLIDGPSAGWNRPGPVAALVGGTVLLIAFVLRERRARMPVLPLSLFSSAQFSAASDVRKVAENSARRVDHHWPEVDRDACGKRWSARVGVDSIQFSERPLGCKRGSYRALGIVFLSRGVAEQRH